MLARRHLLKALAAIPALALNLPAQAQAQPPLRQLPLRGLDRHQGRALWPVFGLGDPLRLALPRDESASATIAVYWGEFLIGGLPEAECEALQPCLARGELRAAIAGLREPSRELIVGIWRRG